MDPRGRLEEGLEEASRNILEQDIAMRKRRGMQNALEKASRSLEELSSLRDKGTNPRGMTMLQPSYCPWRSLPETEARAARAETDVSK